MAGNFPPQQHVSPLRYIELKLFFQNKSLCNTVHILAMHSAAVCFLHFF